MLKGIYSVGIAIYILIARDDLFATDVFSFSGELITQQQMNQISWRNKITTISLSSSAAIRHLMSLGRAKSRYWHTFMCGIIKRSFES